KYAYMVIVFETATKQPVLFVASEVNGTAKEFGGGSHFLGVFEEKGHINMGSSDDWGDPRKFFPKAMQIAKDRFLGKSESANPS
ncbi:MAG TPA: hypothetical protein VN541_06860, partial [Tepidisphaeraceae bacterium]|nr:hypothetical protein [Tepidisphaeraceae bacterium]